MCLSLDIGITVAFGRLRAQYHGHDLGGVPLNRRKRGTAGHFGRLARASVVCLGLPGFPTWAAAEEALVAVAANFLNTAETLAERFTQETGHEVILVGGSTGALYARIGHGAEYDVLLAADRERPARLENEALAVSGSRFTYALGRISFWSVDPGALADGIGVLISGDFRRLAIANPELAPYGLAARQALEYLGLGEVTPGKLVLGQNAGQAMAMTATGNAELGIVPTSFLTERAHGGSRWDIPATAHDPIRQDAALLQAGRDNRAAVAFLDFLGGSAAREMIEAAGYEVPE